MSGFGECLNCGCSVERVGWDDLCFRCQESEKAELIDEDEEDFLPDSFDDAVRGMEVRGRDHV